MPGARMCDVLNAAGPELNVAGQDDCIAILAGTNDISNNGCADITEQIEALCRGASGTNILIKFPSSESFYEETTQTGSNSDVCQRIPILITDRSLSRKRSSTVSSIPARRSAVDVASFVYSGTVTDKTIFLEQNRICGKVP
ncbi:hypothetical protein J6590_060031 [Homalodisca vitripennis]|nr:hypothetical protein J6590_060031 [Homalodisca vitripennis]